MSSAKELTEEIKEIDKRDLDQKDKELLRRETKELLTLTKQFIQQENEKKNDDLRISKLTESLEETKIVDNYSPKNDQVRDSQNTKFEREFDFESTKKKLEKLFPVIQQIDHHLDSLQEKEVQQRNEILNKKKVFGNYFYIFFLFLKILMKKLKKKLKQKKLKGKLPEAIQNLALVMQGKNPTFMKSN